MVDHFSSIGQDGRISPGIPIEPDEDIHMTSGALPESSTTMYTGSPNSRSKKRSTITRSQPRPIHTPTSPLASTIPHNLLPSAPASPPTPAPSPTPLSRAPDWSTASEDEDSHTRTIRALFSDMKDDARERLLGEILNMCTSSQLSFVHEFVSPRLKKDPFTTLPNELCLRVCTLRSYHSGPS